MKRTKRIFAIFMTLALAMSMMIASSVASFAAPTTQDLTVPDVDGHTYEIFQIFTGDLSTSDSGDKVLSNIKWGVNGAEDEGTPVEQSIIDELGNITSTSNAQKVDEILGALDMEKTDLADNAAFKKDVAAGATESVPSGYYIVKDKDQSQANKDDAYTLLLVNVVGPTSLSAKMGTPEVEKKVKDKNDTTGAVTEWQDSADYDIGDAVPFKLTATLAENVSSYKKYHITFVDTLEAGKFSAISGLTIKVNNVPVAEVTGYSASTEGYAGDVAPSVNGFTKTIEFTPAQGSTYLPESLNGATVTIEYNATLGTGAALGTPGNENKVKLEYSNNPNDDQGGEEGQTPEDKVKVFTYKVDVNKVTGTPARALTGANFTLYKEVAGTTTGEGDSATTTYPEGAQTGATIKSSFDTSVKAGALKDNSYYVEVGNKTGDATCSTFEFKGIDDGKYVLVETTIPNGYNAWDATEFEVSAEHSETADEPELTELSGGNLFTGDLGSVTLASGTLETSIANNSGAELPSTGGIGTIIFYVLGSLLVVGCGIVLISKKRMESR